MNSLLEQLHPDDVAELRYLETSLDSPGCNAIGRALQLLTATAASVVGSRPEVDENYVATWEQPNATAPYHLSAALEINKVLGLTKEQSVLSVRLITSVLGKEEERTEYWKSQHKYCVGRIDDLEKQLSPAPVVSEGAGQGWVSVRDRLPEVGWNTLMSHPILVFGLGTVPSIRHYEPGAEAWYDNAHGVSEPRRYYSHWMPLPTPPQPQKGGQ